MFAFSLFSQVTVYFLKPMRWAHDLLQPHERNIRAWIFSMHLCSLIWLCPPGIWDPLWDSIHSIISWTFNLAPDSWCKLNEIDLDTVEILESCSVEPQTDVESLSWFQQNPQSHSWLVHLWLYCKPELKKKKNL